MRVNKTFKRFIKEQNKYPDFMRWAKLFSKKYNTKGEIIMTDPIEHFDSYLQMWDNFNGNCSVINEYTKFITDKIIGREENFKLFEKFLTENHSKQIFTQYLSNINMKFIHTQMGYYNDNEEFKALKIKVNENDKIDTVKNLSYAGYLFFGFEWAYSPQGHEYWSAIHKEWLHYVDNYVEKLN
jgi:hypothetical protein